MTERKSNTNRKLTNARKARKDEYYTQREVIEDELHWYKNDFQGHTVLCNCNDWPKDGFPRSEFVRFFMRKMASWNIPKLIAVGYRDSYGTLFEEGHGTLYELVNDGRPSDQPYTEDDFKVTELEESGGFETPECERLLDIPGVIVCTNPPFSRLRDYLPLLDRHHVGFLVLAPINAVTYKEIFPLFKDERCWLGVSIHGGERAFWVPEEYADDSYGFARDAEGHAYAKVGVRWFTNLPSGRIGKNELSLEGNRYYGNESKYPKYDDYDAINVDRTQDIPEDYFGEMGVPITFLDKWAPSDSDIERERERERTDSKSSENSTVGRRNRTTVDDQRSTGEFSSSGSSSDVPSCRGAEAWEGRALGQGGASNRREGEVHEASHPTFRLIGLDRYVPRNPHPGRRFTISGHEIYARLLIRRNNPNVLE